MARSYEDYSAARCARLAQSLANRAEFGAGWKVSIGHTIWDDDCGATLDLEDTHGWGKALEASRDAAWAIQVVERQAYHGKIVAWRNGGGLGAYVWFTRPLDSRHRDR